MKKVVELIRKTSQNSLKTEREKREDNEDRTSELHKAQARRRQVHQLDMNEGTKEEEEEESGRC